MPSDKSKKRKAAKKNARAKKLEHLKKTGQPSRFQERFMEKKRKLLIDSAIADDSATGL